MGLDSERWLDYSIAVGAAVLLAVIFSSGVASYYIQGDSVIEESAYYRINQTPHTLHDFTNYPIVSVWNKANTSVVADFAFGFDSPDIRPTQAWLWNANAPHEVVTYGEVPRTYTCVEPNVFSYQVTPYKYFWCNTTQGVVVMNHSFLYGYVANKSASWNEWGQNGTTIVYYADWVDVSGAFQSVEWRGKTWFYKSNINFAANETKLLKAKVEVQPNTRGKYDLFAKLSTDSFEDAWASGRYVWLDPWFNVNWNLRKPINVTESYGVERYNEPVNVNVTGLTLSTGSCRQELRVTANFSTETATDFVVLNNSGQTAGAGNAWCFIQFLVNVSTSTNASYVKKNETNYWVYYDNPTAPNVTVNRLLGWNFNYDGMALPLDDGWTFVGVSTGVTNYSFNSSGNSILNLNSTGAGYALFYKITDVGTSWTYEVRTKHISDSGQAAISSAHGFSTAGNYEVAINIKNNITRVGDIGDGDIYNEKNMTTIDDFHVYRLTFNNNTKSYVLYGDGVVLTSGSNASGVLIGNSRIFMGEEWYSPAYAWNADIDYVYASNETIYPPLTSALSAEESLGTTPILKVNIVSPVNGTTYSATSVADNFTPVTTTFSSVNCSRWLNGTQTDFGLIANNTEFDSTFNLPTVGDYNYTLTCFNSTTVNTTFLWIHRGTARLIVYAFDESSGTQLTASFRNENATGNYTSESGVWYFNQSAGETATGTVKLSANATGFYPRSVYSFFDDNTSVTQNVYLLNTSLSYAVNFEVLNSLASPISGAFVQINRSVGGVPVLVASGYTDSAGLFSTYLESGASYSVTANHSSYGSASVSVTATTNLYYITIGTNATFVLPPSCYTNLSNSLSPYSRNLFRGTGQTVNWSIVSVDGQLSYWGWDVSWNGTVINSSNYSNPNGGLLTAFLDFNASNASGLVGVYVYWFRNGAYDCNLTNVFFVRNVTGNTGLFGALQALKTDTGIGDNALMLLVLILVTSMVVYASRYTMAGGAVIGIIVLSFFTFIANWISPTFFLILALGGAAWAVFAYQRGF